MTGPDPVRNQLIEIAAIKCDPKNFGIVDTFSINVGVRSGESSDSVLANAHPGALKKVKICKELLELGSPPEEAVKSLREWLPEGDYIWVGYNLMLDFMFLRRAREPEIRFNYRFIDITSLIELYMYKTGKEIAEFSLESVASSLKICTSGDLHIALNDVKLGIKVFKFLIKELNN